MGGDPQPGAGAAKCSTVGSVVWVAFVARPKLPVSSEDLLALSIARCRTRLSSPRTAPACLDAALASRLSLKAAFLASFRSVVAVELPRPHHRWMERRPSSGDGVVLRTPTRQATTQQDTGKDANDAGGGGDADDGQRTKRTRVRSLYSYHSRNDERDHTGDHEDHDAREPEQTLGLWSWDDDGSA